MTDSYKKYRNALSDIYSSPQGETIFEYLEKAYVEASCFDTDTNSLVYRLAQKELIQNIILEAKTKYEEGEGEHLSYT